MNVPASVPVVDMNKEDLNKLRQKYEQLSDDVWSGSSLPSDEDLEQLLYLGQVVNGSELELALEQEKREKSPAYREAEQRAREQASFGSFVQQVFKSLFRQQQNGKVKQSEY
jgi:hypothetical protein